MNENDENENPVAYLSVKQRLRATLSIYFLCFANFELFPFDTYFEGAIFYCSNRHLYF